MGGRGKMQFLTLIVKGLWGVCMCVDANGNEHQIKVLRLRNMQMTVKSLHILVLWNICSILCVDLLYPL